MCDKISYVFVPDKVHSQPLIYTIHLLLAVLSRTRTSRPPSYIAPATPATVKSLLQVQPLSRPEILTRLGHLVLRAAVLGLALVAFIGEPFLEAHLAAFFQHFVVRVLGLLGLGQAAAGSPGVVGRPLLLVAADLHRRVGGALWGGDLGEEGGGSAGGCGGGAAEEQDEERG